MAVTMSSSRKPSRTNKANLSNFLAAHGMAKTKSDKAAKVNDDHASEDDIIQALIQELTQ
jgi:hypothetical protein